MDFHRLAIAKRDPEILCKKYKIPASRTNKAMVHALNSVQVETMSLLIEATPKDLDIDFHRLARIDLQSLCKKNMIRANMSNQAMVEALIALNYHKSVKKKVKANKSTQNKKLRKKSISKSCEITKSNQEKEIVSPFVDHMQIEDEKEARKDWMGVSPDVIFLILSLLPTEAILRLKTLCRDWACVISDPVFIRAHYSRPTPITSFFTHYINSSQGFGKPNHFFKPLPSCPKFPSMITVFLSSGFKAASTSHGLICFHRDKDGVIVLINPVTSQWALIPRPQLVSPSPSPPTPPSPSSMITDGDDGDDDDDADYDDDDVVHAPPLIIYDPTWSLHFKIAVATARRRFCSLRFRIYSSETSSWTLSSFPPPEKSMQAFWCSQNWYDFKGSKMGGGSVCYWGGSGYNTLCGYEITSDTYWMTPLPWSGYMKREEECCRLIARDGEIYSVVFYRVIKTIKVRRLDENKCWVLEGEGNSEELEKFRPTLMFPHLSYDEVRKALIFTVVSKGLYAFYLSSSRIEVLGEDFTGPGQAKLPHANTLASFHGGKIDAQALDELLHEESIDSK